MTERNDEMVIEDDKKRHWYCVGFQYSVKGKAAGFGSQNIGLNPPVIRKREIDGIKKTIMKGLIDQGLSAVEVVPVSISFLGVMTKAEFES